MLVCAGKPPASGQGDSGSAALSARFHRGQFNRKAIGVWLTRLQYANPDALARDFLAARIGNGNNHAVFARSVREGNRNSTLHAHRGGPLRLWLALPGIEAQMMPARRAYICAEQYGRPAVRTGSR